MHELKSYLVRAVRDWAMDSGLTPHLLVDATIPGVDVPAAFVNNGRIVLNVHPRAIQHFDLDRDCLRFHARFVGRSLPVALPIAAVLAVYAHENGQGVSFPEGKATAPPREPTADAAPAPAPKQPQSKGPTLRIVK